MPNHEVNLIDTQANCPSASTHGANQPDQLSSPLTAALWDDYVLAQNGHLLQSWAWGELKSHFGWTPIRLHTGPAAAQLLFKRLPLGLTIAYLPKGPLIDWTDAAQCRAIFTLIHAEAKKRRAIFLKIEPNLWSPDLNSSPGFSPAPPSPHSPTLAGQTALNFLSQSGFTPADTIQPRTTLIVNLTDDETTWLAAMKQKTRYNIRLAQKKGVTVRQGSAADVATFYHLAQTTAARDSFGIHNLDYYESALALFAPDRCALWLAEFEGCPLAALMTFSFGSEAYYFYGASDNEGRQLMPSYLLQWAAMGWAKSRGCTRYDLWGIPDAAPHTLEAEFEQRHDGLWGVYRFKRGFGGQWRQSLGAFDFVYNPLLYRLYRQMRSRF
jgi:lipid II:glycine glycyltransferase (peptidoglycan interpeptide bridge formation enzyme)